MALYSAPPPAREFRDDKPTLLVCWWCTIFAAVIILFRVCGRYIRTEKLFKEDKLAFYCMIPLFVRMALVHVVLLYGTNNAITTGLTPEQIYHRTIGSRLVLASRIFYAATLWMLKLTILEFFKRLTGKKIWNRLHEIVLQFIRYFLLATFIAVAIADLAECQSITRYWQVVPDPGGKCRQGYAQLLTMGTANVMTDILLVAFPIPIIIGSQMGTKKKLQLVALFAGSLLPAGTTLYRIPKIIGRDGGQQYRSLLASVEILFATSVANALVLGSFVRDRGVKKQRWKLGSMSDSIERTAGRRGTTARQWGSDEDLVRELGLGVDPSLRSEGPKPRAPPMALTPKPPVYQQGPGIGQDWHFPQESDTSNEVNFAKTGERATTLSDMVSPRKVSFFDVGGLLDEDRFRRISSTKTTDTDGEISTQGAQSNVSYEYNSGLLPAPPRREGGSIALLQDIGGFLGPRPARTRPDREFELQTILQDSPRNEPPRPTNLKITTTHSLQDVGGLLSTDLPKPPNRFA
ncbi:hypothetical protein BJ878DRAFT_243262 [Calycina marina]|uniref:Rhodopsin domain-containing protein n=1 Tax=Calycina marina TaxID=1763456 RepID=A0A9P8CC25_9HELO|nr:hypothetical protein BJ878DRAFT_243262 [Calycina marina]